MDRKRAESITKNLNEQAQDTIAAIATAPGRGGVAMVRVSGPDAWGIAERVAGDVGKPRRAALRKLRDGDANVIDEALVVGFAAPASFTGEDVVELHTHGGRVVPQLVLDALIAAGARIAEPGEFSLRAFLNDRLDLAQAEAVADLVDAGSKASAQAALRSLDGEFSQAVDALTKQWLLLRAEIEAGLDFPDEELDLSDASGLAERLGTLIADWESLLASCESGRVLRDGLQLALAGPPNAGKSSLLNRLAKTDRAIVTDIPGTTRDTLVEHLELDGLPVTIVDTAGLREAADPIEQEGVRRSRHAANQADLVLWVSDIRESEAAARAAAAEEMGEQSWLCVLNKCDLVENVDADHALVVSALTGAGLNDLVDSIKEAAGVSEGGGSFSARQRHVTALRDAGEHLLRARTHVSEGDGELAAEELRLGQEPLATLTGRVTSDDVLGQIFSQFCIGK